MKILYLFTVILVLTILGGYVYLKSKFASQNLANSSNYLVSYYLDTKEYKFKSKENIFSVEDYSDNVLEIYLEQTFSNKKSIDDFYSRFIKLGDTNLLPGSFCNTLRIDFFVEKGRVIADSKEIALIACSD